MNLVGNALKFTPAGHVTVRALSPEPEPDGAQVRLVFEVEDSGIGIHAEDLQRIFVPFEQVDASSTRSHGGTGLGLALSQRLAQAMGGSIGVRSEPGVGSCFSFSLLVHEAPATATAPADDDLVALVARIRSRHGGAAVLVVEDDPLNREILHALLEDAGLQVVEAADGAQAVAAARQQRPQPLRLVLMDVRLPVLNGLDATRSVRASGPQGQMPVIALTANAFAEDRQACTDAGMNDFLVKPVKPETVLAAVLKWLEAGAVAAVASGAQALAGHRAE
jgi:CheY-like chemotaxis protein